MELLTVDIDSDNGLVSSGINPKSKPIFSAIFIIIWCHYATMGEENSIKDNIRVNGIHGHRFWLCLVQSNRRMEATNTQGKYYAKLSIDGSVQDPDIVLLMHS